MFAVLGSAPFCTVLQRAVMIGKRIPRGKIKTNE